MSSTWIAARPFCWLLRHLSMAWTIRLEYFVLRASYNFRIKLSFHVWHVISWNFVDGAAIYHIIIMPSMQSIDVSSMPKYVVVVIVESITWGNMLSECEACLKQAWHVRFSDIIVVINNDVLTCSCHLSRNQCRSRIENAKNDIFRVVSCEWDFIPNLVARAWKVSVLWRCLILDEACWLTVSRLPSREDVRNLRIYRVVCDS